MSADKNSPMIKWSAETDEVLIKMRLAGEHWSVVSRALGCSAYRCKKRFAQLSESNIDRLKQGAVGGLLSMESPVEDSDLEKEYYTQQAGGTTQNSLALLRGQLETIFSVNAANVSSAVIDESSGFSVLNGLGDLLTKYLTELRAVCKEIHEISK